MNFPPFNMILLHEMHTNNFLKLQFIQFPNIEFVISGPFFYVIPLNGLYVRDKHLTIYKLCFFFIKILVFTELMKDFNTKS